MTDSRDESILAGAELDILQEIMNIAFGTSAADLADVMNARVLLNVPEVAVLKVREIPDYFRECMDEKEKLSIVTQKFWGRFKGDALLIFSSGAGRELIRLLQPEELSGPDSYVDEVLERETLIEVGNILIGACVGRLAELLNDVVTYTPPIVLVDESFNGNGIENTYDPESVSLVFRTAFTFHKKNVRGSLFLIAGHDSFVWLRKSLHAFTEKYECY